MHVFDVERLVVSDYALREGVLLDTVQRSRGGTLHHLRDVSRAQRAAPHGACATSDPEHSAHVARLALELFDATAPVHGLDEACREYLEAAALLANVGLFISHSKHHLHTYYVIRNTRAPHRLHRPRDRDHRPDRPLPPQERAQAGARSVRPRCGPRTRGRACAGRAPARRHRPRPVDERRVATVRCQDDGERLTIGPVPAGEGDIALEHYAADARKALLEEVLDRLITIA